MSSLAEERARNAGRRRAQQCENTALLFLAGCWGLRAHVPEELTRTRRSAPLWMAGEEALRAAAEERFPEWPVDELVATAVRLQGDSSRQHRRIDAEAWVVKELQYAQSWIHDWREAHPRGTEAEAWRAFELAKEVRHVKRSTFSVYWQQAKPGTSPRVERLREELRIPAPHANGADGPERIEPVPTPPELPPEVTAAIAPLTAEVDKVAELARKIEEREGLAVVDIPELGVSGATSTEQPGRWAGVAAELFDPPRMLERRTPRRRVFIESERGRFEAEPAVGGGWLIELHLEGGTEKDFEELLARALVMLELAR